ncbi:MAG: bifunctional SulP family inorganic anion transporter/carbonic anhydrase [Sphingobacteriaceae bacterium]
MFSKIKFDLPASVVVFLVALPLCLGVALASGAPMLSGVIAGVIGGVIVGLLSESHTSVSGPAAGLAAVILTAIGTLGSFDLLLMAVVIAGSIQLLSGIFKLGFIADYIPSNVIKGLLAAIGIILILKQIPHSFGYDADVENDFSFIQQDGENTFSELINVVNHFSGGAIIVSLISLLVLIYWDKTPLKKYNFLPASLFVVISGILINIVFQQFFPTLYIEQSHLVNIPKINGILSLVTTPDFTSISNPQVWMVGFTIAIVASLETLLNLEAVENIDPHKRKASPNKELVAQGIGNIFSGLVGGIPITSVIVRSSVNINAGAATKMSAILHGLLLLVSVLFISPFLNLIPIASLAAILLVTGYKLAKVSLFKEMYKKGLNQFIPFIATILAIVFTDLLIGILIGLTVSIFYLMKSNFKNPFKIEKEILAFGETIRMELPNQVSFLNKASIKDTLWSIPEGSKLIIDANYSDYIDNDILEIIEDFKSTVSKEKNIKLNIVGLKTMYQLDDHIQFVNVLDKESQGKLKPEEVLSLLKLGNERFLNGKWSEKNLKHQINATSLGQNPMATIVCCIDSRTNPDLIFNASIGDLVSIRIAGNIINDDILGSIELACKDLGTKLVVVLGHSNCGAIAKAVQGNSTGHISKITNKIEKSIQACNFERHLIAGDEKAIERITQLNVENSIAEILDQSEYLKNKAANGEIKIVSGIYDTQTGAVLFN